MDTTVNNNQTGKTGYGKWIAGIALGALAIANGFMLHRVNTLETNLSKQSETTETQFAMLHEADASSATAMNDAFESINTQLQEDSKNSNAELKRAVANAQATAQKNAEKMIAQVKEQQRAREEQFEQEIGAVRSVTNEHAAKVSGLETSVVTVQEEVGNVQQKVGNVQQEVAQTKTTLDQTLSDLKSVRGDLGVQSGLIATNSKELAALKELGDKTYYEFTLDKKKPARVANMTLELRKADVKKNKYNLRLVADDKQIEKNDKTINEPVQLYISGSRIPYEIVVNEVKKDVIVGYVAVPKVTLRAAR